MASYLELDELEVGGSYECELYDGEKGLILRYQGGDLFERPGTGELLSVCGDVRYVRPVGGFPEELQ